jgi:hypothetical protein
MQLSRITNAALGGAMILIIAACGQNRGTEPRDTGSGNETQGSAGVDPMSPTSRRSYGDSSILAVFRGGDQQVKVNRHLWTASLDVLNFLPIEAADPFTGIISTGFGTPPGGGQAYRATILISDPALDARSLNVALQTRSGPVAAGTQRAVEDAILDRARQLRVDSGRY